MIEARRLCGSDPPGSAGEARPKAERSLYTGPQSNIPCSKIISRLGRNFFQTMLSDKKICMYVNMPCCNQNPIPIM